VSSTSKAKASAPAYDTALAAQLWAMSERLTGLVPAPAEPTDIRG